MAPRGLAKKHQTGSDFRKMLAGHKVAILFWVSVATLALICVYTFWYANYYLSGNSDDIVYPYLFQHFKLHDMVLPGQHSNILKFPLFALQSVLPYTFTTLTIVNITLAVATVVIWFVLLVWIFGKRYAPSICALLAVVLLGSQLLNYDLLGTTIRNIEYPIVLAFIIFTGFLLKKRKLSTIQIAIGLVLGLMYSLTVAGDSFFLYTISLSLVIILIIWLKGGNETKESTGLRIALTYLAGFTFIALAIREAVKFLGISHFFTAGVFSPHVLPLSHLGPSVSTANTQILDLFGANVFGQQASFGNSLSFLRALLLAVGLIGLIYMFVEIFFKTRRLILIKKLGPTRVFALGAIATAFFVIYAVYILSDLVVTQTGSGSIASSYQERYITLLPLLLIVGVSYFLWRNFESAGAIYIGFPLIILALLLVNFHNITSAHTYNGSLREGEIAVANESQKSHIPLLITGYWYGSTTRFWSHNKMMFASIAACNQPQPSFNNRLSWYVPSPDVKSSALVVVHKGVDAPYWQCSDDQLKSIYGNPVKIIHVNTADQPDIWLYNYDLRTKLAPLSY